jgi:hypothetical protein
VLSVGPIRRDLQANLAVARVAEQPPALTPASLLERTGSSTGLLLLLWIATAGGR